MDSLDFGTRVQSPKTPPNSRNSPFSLSVYTIKRSMDDLDGYFQRRIYFKQINLWHHSNAELTH